MEYCSNHKDVYGCNSLPTNSLHEKPQETTTKAESGGAADGAAAGGADAAPQESKGKNPQHTLIPGKEHEAILIYLNYMKDVYQLCKNDTCLKNT